MASLRCCALSPDGPGAVPLEKDLTIFLIEAYQILEPGTEQEQPNQKDMGVFEPLGVYPARPFLFGQYASQDQD